jgi:hypothetical protein
MQENINFCNVVGLLLIELGHQERQPNLTQLSKDNQVNLVTSNGHE